MWKTHSILFCFFFSRCGWNCGTPAESNFCIWSLGTKFIVMSCSELSLETLDEQKSPVFQVTEQGAIDGVMLKLEAF